MFARGQTFPVILDQVRDFDPLLQTDLLYISQVSELSLRNSEFQLSPKIFDWIEI